MQVMDGQMNASHDGITAEALASVLFGMPVSVNALIDYESLNGVPCEVKSCRRWIRTNHVSTARRRGRFMLNADQHEHLLKNGGYYLFVLLDDAGTPGDAKCIPARDIWTPRLHDPRARAVGLVWSSIMPEAV